MYVFELKMCLLETYSLKIRFFIKGEFHKVFHKHNKKMQYVILLAIRRTGHAKDLCSEQN